MLALVQRAAAAAWLLAGLCHAGEFTVTPIRLELGPGTRSGVIAVRNDSKEAQKFQLQAMEWTQDKEGRDSYAETPDLVYFPRLMALDPGREGVIRVGVRNPLVEKERTFRLFIEELPSPPAAAGAEGARAQLQVLMRFAAPVFVRPAKPRDGLELEQIQLARGEVSLVAHNTGNQHQFVEGVRITALDAAGAEVHSVTLADRYLLAGTRKRYATEFPAQHCPRAVKLNVEFKTNKLTQRGSLDVDRRMCG